jgi:hypothetical protein
MGHYLDGSGADRKKEMRILSFLEKTRVIVMGLAALFPIITGFAQPAFALHPAAISAAGVYTEGSPNLALCWEPSRSPLLKTAC